jgi:heat-inducible transcriptional repressor
VAKASQQFESSLSPRKREILRKVIDHYVREVHPVSSQRLAEEVHVSSATVRNELAALEEQGFLLQPHTSGGRIPTDLAYRFLVEELISQLADTISHRARVSEVYSQLRTEVEALLEGTLDLLTEMTGYVAWVSLPLPSALDIKSVNFVEVDDHEVLIVLVTGAGVIQSRRLTFEIAAKDLGLPRLTEELNNYLRGRSVIEVDYRELKRIIEHTVALPESMLATLQEFFSGLASGSERVMFGNALRLALEPEFTSVDRLSNIMNVLQDRERFVRALHRQLNERAVQTIIGSENSDPDLKDCSLVLARYSLPERGEGTVGVIGPTRLFYARTLPWVKAIGEVVAQALKDSAGKVEH